MAKGKLTSFTFLLFVIILRRGLISHLQVTGLIANLRLPHKTIRELKHSAVVWKRIASPIHRVHSELQAGPSRMDHPCFSYIF